MIATYNGAKVLDIADEVGSIEVGKQADLVILNANPVKDSKNTRKIESILKNGKLYKPSELLSKKINYDYTTLTWPPNCIMSIHPVTL